MELVCVCVCVCVCAHMNACTMYERVTNSPSDCAEMMVGHLFMNVHTQQKTREGH